MGFPMKLNLFWGTCTTRKGVKGHGGMLVEGLVLPTTKGQGRSNMKRTQKQQQPQPQSPNPNHYVGVFLCNVSHCDKTTCKLRTLMMLLVLWIH